jgi:hypothetical protein
MHCMYYANVKLMVIKHGEDLNNCALIHIQRCRTECVTREKTNRSIIELREVNLRSIL